MVDKSFKITKCKIIVYFNSDILFHRDIILLINFYLNNNLYLKRKILKVGKRGDIYWRNITNIDNHNLIWSKCKPHSGYGIDYFIFSKFTFSFTDIKILDEIVVGRVRYDNIILSLALKGKDNIVIDTTKYVKAVHLSICKKEKEELSIVYIYIYI